MTPKTNIFKVLQKRITKQHAEENSNVRQLLCLILKLQGSHLSAAIVYASVGISQIYNGFFFFK